MLALPLIGARLDLKSRLQMRYVKNISKFLRRSAATKKLARIGASYCTLRFIKAWVAIRSAQIERRMAFSERNLINPAQSPTAVQIISAG